MFLSLMLSYDIGGISLLSAFYPYYRDIKIFYWTLVGNIVAWFIGFLKVFS